MAGQKLWFFLRDQFLFGLRAAACPRFYAALILGFSAWLLPEPGLTLSLRFLALSALAEEVVFRLLLQGEIHRLMRGIILLPGLSLANIATSSIFAAVHLLHQPPLWALSVFFPSLVFGWAMDRYHSVLPPVLLHFCYNLLYFYRF
ncbi:MAG: JDVT-CTERM system CAAX-type protease [Desulfohalobiaceae bacterium]|nr:JDVT-CTERM system CAAX-type protease [Desulfohalobiaceae bacterium]